MTYTSVPILGMILGNGISAVGIAMNYVQREIAENRDKVETYLAFGASRFEACKPVGVEALKLALLPTVNQLRFESSRLRVTRADSCSVIGLISIPG